MCACSVCYLCFLCLHTTACAHLVRKETGTASCPRGRAGEGHDAGVGGTAPRFQGCWHLPGALGFVLLQTPLCRRLADPLEISEFAPLERTLLMEHPLGLTFADSGAAPPQCRQQRAIASLNVCLLPVTKYGLGQVGGQLVLVCPAHAKP